MTSTYNVYINAKWWKCQDERQQTQVPFAQYKSCVWLSPPPFIVCNPTFCTSKSLDLCQARLLQTCHLTPFRDKLLPASDRFFVMAWRIKSSTSCTGGLCAQCDGRGPSSGGGAHGTGDPGRQRAPESNCEEQQSGAHALQHPPALPSHHSCQQEEQTPHRYLKQPSSCHSAF